MERGGVELVFFVFKLYGFWAWCWALGNITKFEHLYYSIFTLVLPILWDHVGKMYKGHKDKILQFLFNYILVCY